MSTINLFQTPGITYEKGTDNCPLKELDLFNRHDGSYIDSFLAERHLN